MVIKLDACVGIFAWNEEKNIGRLLKEVTSNDYLLEIDNIIVVSSQCTDKTDEIVKFATNDKRISLIQERQRKGIASAVNKIIKSCEPTILILISADVIPYEHVLKRMIAKFEDPKIGAVSSFPIPLNAKKGIGIVSHLMWELHNFSLQNLMETNDLGHVTGQLCAFRYEIVKKGIPNGLPLTSSYSSKLFVFNQNLEIPKHPEKRQDKPL